MEYAFWVVFMVAMLVIETTTINLISIWFALGSLGAIVAKMFGASLLVQIGVFLAVSIISLIIAWPLVKKHRLQKTVATNFDAIIGMEAIVTEEISKDKFAGTVRVAGKEWSAITETGENVSAGETVRVKSISGVKLVVNKENN